MRKVRIIILINLLIIPSFFLLFSTLNTTNLTSLNNNEKNNENYYFERDLLKTADDSFEPNDYNYTAREISKGYYEFLSCEDDDWYKFWVEKDEELGVNIYFLHSDGNLDMEIYEESDQTNPILTADSWDDDEYLSFMATYSGYYYIKIYYFMMGPNYNYKLDIYSTGDKFEPNNDFWSAHEVYKGYYRHLHCRNDDWYKFYTNWGESYSVDLYFNNSYGNLDLEVYDDSYSEVANSKTIGDGESIFFTANYYGYYYIRVYNSSSSDQNDYEMKIGGSEIIIFYEDFEGSLSPKWSGIGGSNYMHVTSRDFSPSSPSHSLWCGNESTGTYDKKEGSYKESATINDIDLTDFAYVLMSFDINITIGYGEMVNLSISVQGSQYYLSPKYTYNLFEMGGTSSNTIGWETVNVDLSFFCGFKDLDISFIFTANDFDNDYEGVKIDNIFINGFKDDDIIGNNLGISVGDEFYYYFPYINKYQWSEVFNKDIFDYSGKNIKLEIFAIYDRGSYWDVIARFWDPWDDFDELKGTDEIKYTIYRNPLNMKKGSDLFIPGGNIIQYLRRADNYDGDWGYNEYNIEHWYESYWNEYSIEFCYDDFRVHLIYMANGVLKGMMIHKNYGSMERVFEMWLGEPYDDEDDEEDEEEEKRAVPGYDVIIMISLISLLSLITAIKMKKTRK